MVVTCEYGGGGGCGGSVFGRSICVVCVFFSSLRMRCGSNISNSFQKCQWTRRVAYEYLTIQSTIKNPKIRVNSSTTRQHLEK